MKIKFKNEKRWYVWRCMNQQSLSNYPYDDISRKIGNSTEGDVRDNIEHILRYFIENLIKDQIKEHIHIKIMAGKKYYELREAEEKMKNKLKRRK